MSDRELKFRAWDKREMKMREVNALHLDVQMGMAGSDRATLVDLYGMSRAYHVGKDVDLMQYTGLKDRNGREIYEGDIVTLPGLPAGEVKWNTSGVEFYVYGPHGVDYQLRGDWKVIGNIYEHPTLLKEGES